MRMKEHLATRKCVNGLTGRFPVIGDGDMGCGQFALRKPGNWPDSAG